MASSNTEFGFLPGNEKPISKESLKSSDLEQQDEPAETTRKILSKGENNNELNFNLQSVAQMQTQAPIFCLVDMEALRSGLAVVDVKDKTANPAALGLLGFGLTTFLLNLHNAGVYPLDSMILAMGLMYGGLA